VKRQERQRSMEICSLNKKDKQRVKGGGRDGQGAASFWVADTGPAAAGFIGATTLSFWVAGAFAVETEADGSPWGFWRVITSSLTQRETRSVLHKE